MSLKYPIGQQDFPKIRNNDYLFIDKTNLIYELVQKSYIFLSRPRRFGKSLLLSTIQAYFEGKKELFKGLELEKLEKDWINYPVFYFELSRIDSFNPESLKDHLEIQLSSLESKYQITPATKDLSARFGFLIQKTAEIIGKRVVILIDEYDNPLLNVSGDPETDEKNRSLLKAFYSNLKAMDGYIRFAMLTGVSRFGKMSIFSGLNNLMDISFNNRFSSICGFTEDEIKKYMWEGIKNFGSNYNLNPDESLKLLKHQYDGYHFSEKCPDLYNPFSLFLALENQKLGKYWIETATPQFLAAKLKEARQSFNEIFNASSNETNLSEPDTSFSSPISLLYQTGYLTIKNYNKETDRYKLGVPNNEVENGLFSYLLSQFSGKDSAFTEDIALDIADKLKRGKIEEFVKFLKDFYTEIPYDIIPVVTERYFQHVLYLLLRVAGIEIDAEKKHSYGRSDIVAKTSGYIFIFELKLDKSADEALRQIEEKEYYLPYLNQGKEIVEIGLGFSSKTRSLSSWTIKLRNQ